MHFLRKRNRETGTFILDLPKNFKVWLQCCHVIAKETPLKPVTALGQKPDGSKSKLQINFCCLNAKYYIWLCRQKKCSPKLNNFLQYSNYIYEIENNTTTIALKKVGASVGSFVIT